MADSDSEDLATHKGGCHCGRIRWEMDAPKSVTTWKCNCSMCLKRGNVSFSVPSHRFKLLSGESNITNTFGTHTAKHTFCNVCGITSFYVSRIDPDDVSINVACIDPGTMGRVGVLMFDGVNWEESYRKHHMGHGVN